MSLSAANELERDGDIAGALELCIGLVTQSRAGRRELSPLYERNAERLFRKLPESHRERMIGLALLNKVTLQPLESPRNGPPGVANADRPDGPLVTVVIPSYNNEKYLRGTIASVVAQTHRDFECIIVDDCSSDGSIAIARAACKSDRRFRLYQHRSNGGLAAARNSGIRLAAGSFVCFLDSDDVLSPTSLENRVRAAQKYRDVDCVAGVYDFSMSVAGDFGGTVPGKAVKGRAEFVDFVSVKGDCPFNANQPMLRRQVLVAMGGFPEKYPQAEDWRLWSKMLRAGYVLVSVPTIGSAYRQTAGSMMRRAPMLHMQKSLGNYFRAHAAYRDEVERVEVRYENSFFAMPLFTEDWGHYFSQQQFMARLFNSIGMELGRQREADSALDITAIGRVVREAVPDFGICSIGLTAREIYDWLEYGYKRYFGGLPGGDSKLDFLMDATCLLLGHLYESTPVRRIGNGERMLPGRRLETRAVEVVDILFVPHKAYHTRSFELLVPHLQAAGLSFAFVDITVPYRDESAYAESLYDHFMSYNEFVLSRVVPRAIVCMNDWDTVVKPMIIHANACGIPTIGMVEGVQDFGDADTGRKRNPYRQVRHVCLPGEFDKKYFEGSGQSLWVTGVQRLDGLAQYAAARSRRGPSRSGRKKVVVNVNFSYGVMTDRRDQWVADVDAACQALGYEMIVSQHPQDDGDLSRYRVSDGALYDLLVECDAFVSRFSGAILESMVIGCPVVYYNGHGEKVDKFHESLGDYLIADSPGELKRALRSAVEEEAVPSGAYLKLHCDIGGRDGASSLAKTTEALRTILRHERKTADVAKFKRLLGGGA